ncbi:hypothetical protein F5884DRAFT_884048 [Xylogone sp. PMI_703]|nr:hypothetical protein F5884DRAFT_884048 [Xylogone sp. PMI_703]
MSDNRWKPKATVQHHASTVRHNQECRYIVPKRRQSSKKSVESALVTPEKSPDASENNITGFFDDAPSSGQMSPILTLPPTSNASSDDSNWCVEMDADGISNLLQSTDLRNVVDFTAFSWPLLTSDSEGQFDFDMSSYTTNPVDGLTPAILNLDDKNLCFSKLNRPYESPSPSAADMTKMLNLNDKAHMRSFLDSIPSVNFSLKAIFSSQDRWHENTRNSKQEEICRIFERISHVQTHLPPVNLNDSDCRGGYASWYWNDPALIENCRAACFDQPLGISNFLTKSCFDKYMKEARGRSPGNSVLISLIDSVMAFGYQAFLKSTQRFVSTDEKRKANYYCLMTLNSYASVLNSPDTLLKLQTILAMTTICEQLDDSVYCELLTGALNCIRSLKLENSDLMVHSNHASIEDQDLARRCLWYFYSVEVPHSIRRGISPSIDRDWIDHSPPQACDETDWFPLQCLYATIVSSAAKMLYSQSALRQSCAEREQKLNMAYKLLEEWRSRLPAPLRDIHQPDMSRILDDHQTRHITLTMFRQYHEAIFMIYFPWTGAQSSSRVSEECRRRSMELCVTSAQVVLATANQVSSLDILDR